MIACSRGQICGSDVIERSFCKNSLDRAERLSTPFAPTPEWTAEIIRCEHNTKQRAWSNGGRQHAHVATKYNIGSVLQVVTQGVTLLSSIYEEAVGPNPATKGVLPNSQFTTYVKVRHFETCMRESHTRRVAV